MLLVALITVLWIVFAVGLAIALIGPRRMFSLFRAPFLKHPEANEPSELAYRIQGGVAWLLVAVLGPVAIAVTLESARDLSADQVEELAWDIKIGMDGAHSEDLLEGPTPASIAADLDDGDRLTIRHVGYSDPRDYYLITNRDGEHPWCLVVETVHGGLSTFPQADYVADVGAGECEVPDGIRRPAS